MPVLKNSDTGFVLGGNITYYLSLPDGFSEEGFSAEGLSAIGDGGSFLGGTSAVGSLGGFSGNIPGGIAFRPSLIWSLELERLFDLVPLVLPLLIYFSFSCHRPILSEFLIMNITPKITASMKIITDT